MQLMICRSATSLELRYHVIQGAAQAHQDVDAVTSGAWADSETGRRGHRATPRSCVPASTTSRLSLLPIAMLMT